MVTNGGLQIHLQKATKLSKEWREGQILKRLKLVRAAEVLETVVSRTEEAKSSYLSFLDHLLEEEVAAKEKRRIQTALKIAGLPFAKTIEEYDFLFHPHLDKKAVMELFDLTFLGNHENVIFLGPTDPDT